MIFEKGYLYHIYNRGNNKQKIFYSKENYLFFLKKINEYILPFGDILAWCLMPNHFHIMALVNEVEIPIEKYKESSSLHNLINKTSNNIRNNTGTIHQMANIRGEDSHQMNSKTRTLNSSIAILLRSYTAAINKQENTTGSLFKAHTKAECINCFNGFKPSFIQSNISLADLLPEKQYSQVCFDYIHQNPVKAHLVKNSVDWEFSSAKDYAGLRNGKLINKAKAEEYVTIR